MGKAYMRKEKPNAKPQPKEVEAPKKTVKKVPKKIVETNTTSYGYRNKEYNE